MKKMAKLGIFIPVWSVLIVLLVAFIVANAIFSPVLGVAFASTQMDDELIEKYHDKALDVCEELEGEGAVLLKNENNALPISAGKVNVFGARAADPVYNSNGSAAGGTSTAVNLKDGLENNGFTVNEELWQMILNYESDSGNSQVHEGDTDLSLYPLNEADISEYTGNISFQNLKSYSDIAIVNIGRIAGEGQDIPRTGFGDDGTDSYLELCENEKNLLKELKNNGFKTIVLINSSYTMELGFIDQEEYGVEAALWIGGPGVSGFNAVAQLLKGEINPSGRLSDTWAYDLTTQSSYYNTETYKYVTDGEIIGGYTNFSEGIYIGYKWYETADAEGFWDSTFAQEKWNITGYDDVVQYPFGYGLSYTTFEQEFVSTPVYQDGTVTFQVKVTNTGTVSGKDVVQIYMETPYEEGGTEKLKVVLCGFDKTGPLDQGEDETVTISLNLEDFASYDQTGDGCYKLDAGDYIFYLSDNAHSWSEVSGTDKTYTLQLSSAIEYSGDNSRSTDNQTAVNQLSEGQNGNVMSSSNGMEVLSRANGFSNYSVVVPSYTELTVDGVTYKGTELSKTDAMYDQLVTNAKSARSYIGTEEMDTTVGKKAGISFSEMYEVEYEDEMWNEFISQMSVDELITLVGSGGWSTAAIDSIDKPATIDIDGPFGLSNYIKTSMGEEQTCVSYVSEPVAAATFNLDLLYLYGQAVGNEANANGTAGWYAPGANLHRSAFGGRNAEYFSEDTLLTSLCCSAVVEGAYSKGVYTYVKHFAFNDIEANRTNLQNCWIDEQTAREVYLRAFEGPVKQSGCCLMVSYMWVNGEWMGGNSSIMTKIVREEWGMKTMAITDNWCANWMNATKCITGGTDLILSAATRKVDTTYANTDEGITALKTAAKHILYSQCSVQANREVSLVSPTNWWNIIYTVAVIAIAIILVITIAVFVVLYIIDVRRRKKAFNEAHTN